MSKELGFDSWQGQEIFLFFMVSSWALRPTQPLIQWLLGSFSLGLKWQGLEADHSTSSCAKVKNVWSNTFAPPYDFMVRCLIN
jgi:hypothetical protein